MFKVLLVCMESGKTTGIHQASQMTKDTHTSLTQQQEVPVEENQIPTQRKSDVDTEV